MLIKHKKSLYLKCNCRSLACNEKIVALTSICFLHLRYARVTRAPSTEICTNFELREM